MLTIVMLGILRDDDVKAFPHMRFNIGRVMKEDASVTRMVKFLNGLPISSWSGQARRWLNSAIDSGRVVSELPALS